MVVDVVLALPAADPLVTPASFNVLELSEETTVKSKAAGCQSSGWVQECPLAGYLDYHLQTRVPQVDHQADPYDKIKTSFKAL